MPGILAFVPDLALFFMTIVMNTQMPGMIGTLMAAAILGLTGVVVAWRPVSAVESFIRWSPLLLVGILAVASTFWSILPGASLRYGMQLLMTMFLGVYLARLVTPERFVSIMTMGFFVFCVLSILSGRSGMSASGPVLIGLTGSKNQMGYVGCYLTMAALTVLLLPHRDRFTMIAKIIALVSFPVAVYLMIEARALMALLMGVSGVFLIVCLWVSQRLSPGGRIGLLALLLVVATPFLLALPEIEQAGDYLLYDVFDKDPTLTGRTFLWERADALIARRPIEGWGYQAIWMSDSSETIGLQRLTGQDDGRSFHFHNQFRQIGVDTGWIGILAYIGALIATAIAAFRQLVLAPRPATTFFAVIFFTTAARGFSDLVLGPFMFSTMLFMTACVYAFASTVQVRPGLAPGPVWLPYGPLGSLPR